MGNELINNVGNENVGTVHGHKVKEILWLSVPLGVVYQKRHGIAERVITALRC
jgi:hypothetical protein